MKLVAALLALCLLIAPAAIVAQESTIKTVTLFNMGKLTYDTALFMGPDVTRYYRLTQLVLDFIEPRCTPMPDGTGCHIEINQLRLEVFVYSYETYETVLLASLKQEGNMVLYEQILGDGGLIDGHMQHTFFGPRLFFYQMPADTLYVHELLHALYWGAAEEEIKWKQNNFLSSHEYKDWLRENY